MGDIETYFTEDELEARRISIEKARTECLAEGNQQGVSLADRVLAIDEKIKEYLATGNYEMASLKDHNLDRYMRGYNQGRKDKYFFLQLKAGCKCKEFDDQENNNNT